MNAVFSESPWGRVSGCGPCPRQGNGREGETMMKKSVVAVAALCVCGSVWLAGCSKQRQAPVEEAAADKAGAVLDLTDETFDAAVAEGVVLVDFWAPWCPPCRVQGPLVDEAAGLIGDAAKVAKVNVDIGKKSAQKFGVQSIPTLIVFKDGKPVKQFVGVTQPGELVAAVKAAKE